MGRGSRFCGGGATGNTGEQGPRGNRGSRGDGGSEGNIIRLPVDIPFPSPANSASSNSQPSDPTHEQIAYYHVHNTLQVTAQPGSADKNAPEDELAKLRKEVIELRDELVRLKKPQ